MANSNKKATPAKKSPAKKAVAKKAPAKKAVAKKTTAKKPAPRKEPVKKSDAAVEAHEALHKVHTDTIEPIIAEAVEKMSNFVSTQIPDKFEIDSTKAKGFISKLLGKFKKTK